MRQLKKAYLEITNVCNLNCSFCPGTKRAKGFLSPEDFRLLAGRLRPHTQFLYLHLMGEPLLHPHLPELLSIATQLGFHIIITTNATLLSTRGQALLDCPGVWKISLSLHSFEGNHPSMPFGSYLEDCAQFAQRAAAAGKRCALRLWNLDTADIQGENQQNDAILTALEGWFPRPWKDGWQGVTLQPGVFLEWGERFVWPDLSAPQQGQAGFCYGLRDQVGVLWDGTVVPCCLDHEGDLPLGNLYQQSLQEILDSPKAQAIYQGFSQRQAVAPLCLRCSYRQRFT
jgi:radical SAM protein with 4Fe4S-binding SPASM domain